MERAFGLFPIGWIVFAAILLYSVVVESGKFEIIKDSFGGLTQDRRLQALLIAFCFGAFLESAAGFGVPVAVASTMLIGLGFSPFYAAGVCLLANTVPVAFGSIGIPVVTLAAVTGLPLDKSERGRGLDLFAGLPDFACVHDPCDGRLEGAQGRAASGGPLRRGSGAACSF